MKDHAVVWVDIDNTLANSGVWQGIFHFGEPFPGARKFMHDLKNLGVLKGFRVGVLTCRGKLDVADREILEEMYPGSGDAHKREVLEGLIATWMRQHKLPFDYIYTDQGKPVGIAYIDDRAVWCCPKTFGPEHAYATASTAVTNLLR